MAKYESLLPRFLRYVKVNSRSDPNSNTIPSSHKETVFLDKLKIELEKIGLSNVRINKQSSYLFATLPSNVEKAVPVVGFISHVDTADFNSEHVNPQIVKNYDGHSVINLDSRGKYQLDPKVFKNLKNYRGQTLITTDGQTLLGSDDKSGVSEIITAMQYLLSHPEIKHGTIQVGFGPDEEIGTGSKQFDVKDFGADFAYTVDGGPLGDLQYETFNAAAADLEVNGTDVHPGSAKGIMVNAQQLAIDFHNSLPKHDRPELTEGREGFFALESMQGTPDHAHLSYIIRDHDKNKFNERKQLFKELASKIDHQYGGNRVKATVKDEYYNMAEILKKDMTPVNLAKQAMEDEDVKPNIFPVRGGTDGSTISFLGLPTPNIFAGGENMHGRYEYVSLQTMQKAVDVIIKISQLLAN